MGYWADTTFTDVPRPTIRGIVLSPFRVQTYLNLIYLLLAFPLGMLYFVFFVTGFSVAASLVIILIGVPLILVVLAMGHGFASIERVTARHLLSIDIPSPGYPFLESEGVIPRIRSLVLSWDTYKALGYLFSKFFVGLASFIFITVMVSISVTMLLTPFLYNRPGEGIAINVGEPIHLTPSLQIPWGDLLIGLELAVTIANWEVTTLPQALIMSAIGFVFLILTCSICNAGAWVIGRYTQVFLGASRESQRGDWVGQTV